MKPQPLNIYGTQIATDGQHWYIADHASALDAYAGKPKPWQRVPSWRLVLRWQCRRMRRWAVRLA